MSTTNQLDLFVADILDVSPKGDMETMEHPIFALSTKPDTDVWIYERAGMRIEVLPSAAGRPTIFDKDLLMYCISQVVEGTNRGRKPLRTLRVTAYDYLNATGRGFGGKDYDSLMLSAKRLRGVSIAIYDTVNGSKRGRVVGLFDQIRVSESKKGRMGSVDLTLSEWIFDAVTSMQVLAYNRRYYELRSPNDRRMYELCRKFCGNSPKWEIGFGKLYNRFGTRATARKFKQMLKAIVEKNNLPDYFLEFENDKLTVIRVCRPTSAPEPLSPLEMNPQDDRIF